MKVLLTGAGGQLGQALVATAPPTTALLKFNREMLDITDGSAVAKALEREAPALVLNAAAYTAVDRAERESDAARAINADAVRHLAAAARAVGARLVHVSTDFVFDGRASSPYLPGAPTAPLSVYGRTKRDGELAAGADALIVRTGWVYSAGGRNFVHTMLRLMREQDELRVVDDQIGTPTYARGLAEAIWSLARAGKTGIYHYSDNGVASWYDFAVAVQEEALALELIDRAAPIRAVPTSAFPTPAVRPPFAVLDKRATWTALGREAPHWRVNLRSMLRELRDHG